MPRKILKGVKLQTLKPQYIERFEDSLELGLPDGFSISVQKDEVDKDFFELYRGGKIEIAWKPPHFNEYVAIFHGGTKVYPVSRSER